MITSHSFFAKATLMPPDANGPAGFTTKWHGHGANHQGNNAPGDTAANRHGFENATAGKSGHNPTAGSNQDDFSAVAGLPMIPVHEGHGGVEEESEENDIMEMML